MKRRTGNIGSLLLCLIMTINLMLPGGVLAMEKNPAAAGGEILLENQLDTADATMSNEEDVFITSLKAQSMYTAAHRDKIIENELENFDPAKKDYTIKLRNGMALETFTIETNQVVPSINLKVNGRTIVDRTVANTNKVTQPVMLNQWGQSDLTISLNYGSKFNPITVTYTIRILTDTETDANLDTFEIIPYVDDEAGVLARDTGANLYVGADTNKLWFNTIPHHPEATMELTYKKVGGESVTLSLQSGSNMIDDCFGPGAGNAFSVQVKPPAGSTQAARTYARTVYCISDLAQLGSLYVKSPYVDLDLRFELTRPDRTKGFDRNIFDYTLQVPYECDTVSFYTAGAAAYDSKYLQCNGVMYEAEIAPTPVFGDIPVELEAGKRTPVTLKTYTDDFQKWNTYTVTLLRLPPETTIESVTPETAGAFVQDFKSYLPAITLRASSRSAAADFIFNAPQGGTMRWDDPATGPEVTSGEKESVAFPGTRTLYITKEITFAGDTEATLAVREYTVSAVHLAAEAADRVLDYWPAPGQFVNTLGWGSNPYGSFSLGGFGGYVIYQFDDPVKNDPRNLYGEDLRISGNAFVGNSEPANVYVSRDGETWYSLAGGSHYEDGTVWDYQLTYTNKGNEGILWEDNYGQTGTIYQNPYHGQSYYPSTEFYGKWRPDGVVPDSYTVSGVLLPGRSFAFGYVDGNGRGHWPQADEIPASVPAIYKYSAGFDLDWAVDQEGNPVHLDQIRYVKVQNATNMVLGAVGELSAEVTEIKRTDLAPDQSVTRTPLAKAIVVNGQVLDLKAEDIKNGTVVKTVYYAGEGEPFDVTVTPPDEIDGGVYACFIGEPYGTERHYDTVPNKGKLRIVTQNGKNEPLIYIINFAKSEDFYAISLEPRELGLAPETSFDLKVNFLSVEPADKGIEWTSSDETVAAVDADGRVTAVGEGETDIVAISQVGGFRATCRVKVGKVAESVTLNFGSSQLKVGDTATLSASVLPDDAVNKDVIWSSDREEVATVKNGVVTGISPGEAVITAATTNGKTAGCNVTVLPKNKYTCMASVEKFTLGQGYLIEPTQVEFEEGDNAAGIIDSLLTEMGFQYTYEGSIDNNFYLESIQNADTGQLNIPENIQQMAGFNEAYTGENSYFPNLGEGAYTPQSGWFYFVNNEDPEIGMSSVQPEQDDVIRLQFTLYGLGNDLGPGWDGNGLQVANKDILTGRIAEINLAKDEWLAIEKYQQAYDDALAILADHTSSQEEVDAAYAALPKKIPVVVSSITLDREFVELIKGESLQLTATVTPDHATDPTVTWTSDDESVAAVDENGMITAKEEGTVTITAKAGNQTATCSVRVTDTGDTAAPAFAAGYPQIENLAPTGFRLAVRLDEPGAAYYKTVAQGAYPGDDYAGWASLAVPGADTVTASVYGLTAGTAYDVYVIARDTAGNWQTAPVKLEVSTPEETDPAAPRFAAGYPRAANITATGFHLQVKLSVAGAVYYKTVPGGTPIIPEPGQTVAQAVYRNPDGSLSLPGLEEAGVFIGGLAAGASYDIYVIAVDAAGNWQTAPVKLDVTTQGGSQTGFSIERVGTGDFTLGADANVALKITNNNPAPRQATLIVCLYDNSNNGMENYAFVSREILAGEEVTMAGGFPIPPSGHYSIKALVWDSFENMEPLMESPLVIDVN